jgi:hypothetical protein
VAKKGIGLGVFSLREKTPRFIIVGADRCVAKKGIGLGVFSLREKLHAS